MLAPTVGGAGLPSPMRIRAAGGRLIAAPTRPGRCAAGIRSFGSALGELSAELRERVSAHHKGASLSPLYHDCSRLSPYEKARREGRSP